jgi:hypothetical protein
MVEDDRKSQRRKTPAILNPQPKDRRPDMQNPLKITRKQAKAIIDATFPNYRGNKVSIHFQNQITFSDTNWGGGTKNEYAAVASDGRTARMDTPAPWLNAYEGVTQPIGENVLVVEHTIFCGKDLGITIYANTCHMPKWLEAGQA